MAIVILQVLQSGLNILSFNPFFKKFIWGLILILVMVINYFQGYGWPGGGAGEAKNHLIGNSAQAFGPGG